MRSWMKHIVFFLSLILIGRLSPAQDLIYHSSMERNVLNKLEVNSPEDYITFFIATDSNATQADLEEALKDLHKLESKLINKRKKRSDEQFLNFLFYKVHRKYLKHYREYSSFYSVMDKGRYDCLTATTLYAFLLEKFGYSYRIVENNYHIYIVVNTDAQRYIIESTDPVAGFKSDEDEIEDIIEKYNNAQAGNRDSYYQFSFELNNEVNLSELIGLLYYNRAVQAFNNANVKHALNYWLKASIFYQSRRMEAVESLFVEEKIIPDNYLRTQPVALTYSKNP